MEPDQGRESPEPPHDSPAYFVGVGASAGGLEALEALFRNLPADTGLAFVVVQHLSPDYKSLMVELLSKKTAMRVLRIENGMRVEANHVYLIPPKQNLTLFHGKLLLQEQRATHGVNLPIDVFFRSLAEDQAERAIGVVLSGTGSDGTRGVRAIKEQGGMVMVQDEQSARFDGMPRAAISTGLADFVLPPEEMPEQLLAFAAQPLQARRKRSEQLMGEQDSLTRVFAELRTRTKVDFTYYKPSTIIRRLERRMTVTGIDDLDDYVRLLHETPHEVMALYRELLIGVTSFFRDPEAMQVLATDLIPALLGEARNRELRFWVAGCSTGEEAYTLAILAKEAMDRTGISRDVKIFATDIDRDAIVAGGAGVYPESITADVRPSLLSKYFYCSEDHYRITRQIREMVVFAQHNLVRDPPFTNIDLVSCRNLLIYLQPVLQHKALEMFSFSLRPRGILFLGASETVGDLSSRFEPLHQRFKIFRAVGGGRPLPSVELDRTNRSGRFGPRPQAVLASHRRRQERDEKDVLSRFVDLLAADRIPLSVIVNEHMEIVHTVGKTEGYFHIPAGAAVFDITKMANKDLAIPIATGIQKVFRTGEPMSYSHIRLLHLDNPREVRLRIDPLPERKGQEPLVVVMIEESEPRPDLPADTEVFDLDKQTRQHIGDLEQELQFTRENLQATIEELETSNEELQATNEELLASNEELQSTNEELQSTNEELHTVNYEHQKKINELTELNNDVDNLLTHSRIGTLLLDENLEIRKYSREVEGVFRILESDVGRPITHLAHRLTGADPIDAVRAVQRDGRAVERQVEADDGRVYLMRVVPYHIGPRSFSGVVVTFVDITALQRAQGRLARSEREVGEIAEHMPAGLFVYALTDEGELVLEAGNPEASRLSGFDSAQRLGARFDELWPRASSMGLTDRFKKVAEGAEPFHAEELSYRDERLTATYRLTAFALPGRRLGVTFEDITRRRKAESALAESEARFRHLFETMPQGVVYQDADGSIVEANPAAERILGLTLDQMRGRTSMDPRWRAMRVDGSDLPGDEHPAMVALRTGTPVLGFTMGVFNPRDERRHWILVNATPERRQGEDAPCHVYTTFDEVTDLVEAERKLRRAVSRLDHAFAVTGLAWWDLNLETKEVEASPFRARLIGFDPAELPASFDFWNERVHPNDAPRVTQAMRDHLEGRRDSYSATYRLRNEEGGYVLLEDRGRIVDRSEDGKPLRMVGALRFRPDGER